MASSLDHLASPDLDKHLSEVTRKLATELALDEPSVAEVVAAERQRFGDAHIHAFLPILIERSARAQL